MHEVDEEEDEVVEENKVVEEIITTTSRRVALQQNQQTKNDQQQQQPTINEDDTSNTNTDQYQDMEIVNSDYDNEPLENIPAPSNIIPIPPLESTILNLNKAPLVYHNNALLLQFQQEKENENINTTINTTSNIFSFPLQPSSPHSPARVTETQDPDVIPSSSPIAPPQESYQSPSPLKPKSKSKPKPQSKPITKRAPLSEKTNIPQQPSTTTSQNPKKRRTKTKPTSTTTTTSSFLSPKQQSNLRKSKSRRGALRIYSDSENDNDPISDIVEFKPLAASTPKHVAKVVIELPEPEPTRELEFGVNMEEEPTPAPAQDDVENTPQLHDPIDPLDLLQALINNASITQPLPLPLLEEIQVEQPAEPITEPETETETEEDKLAAALFDEIVHENSCHEDHPLLNEPSNESPFQILVEAVEKIALQESQQPVPRKLSKRDPVLSSLPTFAAFGGDRLSEKYRKRNRNARVGIWCRVFDEVVPVVGDGVDELDLFCVD